MLGSITEAAIIREDSSAVQASLRKRNRMSVRNMHMLMYITQFHE